MVSDNNFKKQVQKRQARIMSTVILRRYTNTRSNNSISESFRRLQRTNVGRPKRQTGVKEGEQPATRNQIFKPFRCSLIFAFHSRLTTQSQKKVKIARGGQGNYAPRS